MMCSESMLYVQEILIQRKFLWHSMLTAQWIKNLRMLSNWNCFLICNRETSWKCYSTLTSYIDQVFITWDVTAFSWSIRWSKIFVSDWVCFSELSCCCFTAERTARKKLSTCFSEWERTTMRFMMLNCEWWCTEYNVRTWSWKMNRAKLRVRVKCFSLRITNVT